MTNTMKTLIFIASMFVFIGIYTLISTVITAFAATIPAFALFALYAAFLVIAYIAALYSQALIKYKYTEKKLKSAEIALKLPLSPFKFNERLVAYVLPALAVFVPMFSGNPMSPGSIISVASLIILIIIVELLFYLNSKRMHVYITNKGIAIMGTDIRFELGLPLNYTNLSGFYPYERIDNFLAFPDRVIIYQLFDYNVVTIMCSAEESTIIKGLMMKNHVEEKKNQGV